MKSRKKWATPKKAYFIRLPIPIAEALESLAASKWTSPNLAIVQILQEYLSKKK